MNVIDITARFDGGDGLSAARKLAFEIAPLDAEFQFYHDAPDVELSAKSWHAKRTANSMLRKFIMANLDSMRANVGLAIAARDVAKSQHILEGMDSLLKVLESLDHDAPPAAQYLHVFGIAFDQDNEKRQH